MNNSTNQTDVFGNNFVGSKPQERGSQPLYNNQMQGIQQMPQNQGNQPPVYQNQNVVQPMRTSNNLSQEQMGRNSNQNTQSFHYSNQTYTQGVQAPVYPQNVNFVGQMGQQSVQNQPSFVGNNSQENYGSSVYQSSSFQPEQALNGQGREIVKPTDSYTEMAFAGVNQQEEKPKQITVLTSEVKKENSVSPVEVSVTENMQPVEKKADENAGLRFLGIIFFILIVVILCLPLIGLN